MLNADHTVLKEATKPDPTLISNVNVLYQLYCTDPPGSQLLVLILIWTACHWLKS